LGVSSSEERLDEAILQAGTGVHFSLCIITLFLAIGIAEPGRWEGSTIRNGSCSRITSGSGCR